MGSGSITARPSFVGVLRRSRRSPPYLIPAANIQLTAEELSRERDECGGCVDYVKRYNPGNPTYRTQIAYWERKFTRAAQAIAPLPPFPACWRAAGAAVTE